MSASSKPSESKVLQRIIPALLGLLLPVLFIAICLVLMQWDEVLAAPTQPTAGDWQKLDFQRVFASKSAFVVYDVLLSGLLGSYLRYLLMYFKTDERAERLSLSLTNLAAQLLVGASVAFVVAILLPSAMVVTKRADELFGGGVNIWALLILGGMAGYWSRSALGDLAGVASRLLAQLAQPIGEEAREQINQSIRTGVREAIAPPRLANYDGYLLVDIIEADSPRSSDISGPRSRVLRQPTSVITGEAVAHLSFGTRYLLVVSFTTAVPTAGGREDAPIVKPVHIKDGIDQPTVPFRLYVDFGSVRIPIAERELAVPRTGESQAANFEFTPPAPARSPDVQTPSETTETRSPTAATQPLSIAIYQHGTFCEICHVPQEIETGSSSDQAAVTDPSPLAQ